MATSSADSLVGVELDGRYTIERLASEEMLGKVYVARDGESGGLVQVKVLNPSLQSDSEKFARFGREISATSMVRHPHTVQILDWGHQDDLHYLVLEYLKAHTLGDLLERGPISPSRVAAIVAQVADAIGAAHQEGIVHRNLSPANILLLDNAHKGAFVKVRDFGLSRLENFNDDEPSNLTQAGARVGNVHYMAPEYIEDDQVHPKGDLYSLGTLTYHMLVGHPPYEGKAMMVLSAHVTEDPPIPSEERPELPSWADELVAALMAREPEDRPGAYQVVQHLETATGRSLKAARLLSIDAVGRVIRPSRLPFLAAVTGGVILAAGLGVLLMALGSAGAVALWSNLPERQATAPPVPDEGLIPDPTAAMPGVAAEPELDAPAEPEAAPVAAPRPRPRSSPAAAPDPQPDPADAAVGTVLIRANRRVLVYVDGTAVGYTPLDHPLPEGSHEISVLIPGDSDSKQTRTIDLASGEDVAEFTF